MKAVFWPVVFLSICWLLEIYFESGHERWVFLGILPHSAEGFLGIITAPFIHGGRDHLLSNTLPLLIVGTGLFFFYHQIAYRVIAMIWLFTGFWVWLGARTDSSHIGASGLIYGFVFFLFFSGLIRKDTRLMAVSLLVAFLYGSMVWGILPVDQTVSWESHLAGSIAGIFASIAFRKFGPQRPKAQWEIDEELEAQQALQNQTAEADWIIHYDFVENQKKEEENTGENPPQTP